CSPLNWALVAAKIMNDTQRTRKLRLMAAIYLLGLLLPFASMALSTKENGQAALFIVWPLVSSWYFIIYRSTAKKYDCKMTKHIAFSRGGGGTFHGVLYYFSSFVLVIILLVVVRNLFGG
ncbi:hypothetical protein, partial [Vibrio parahaemolyticus]|uniref:hypothetical protein n=2 Tax=Vibrio parahaemolyticus TaxID=670 RepID=UPI0025552972